MINSPRAASSATVAPISGATTVTTALSPVGLGLPTAPPGLRRRPAPAVRSAQGWRRKQRAARSARRREAITAFTQLLMQVGPELDTRPTAQT